MIAISEKSIMRGKHRAEEGNVLICALCTILIISLIGANVLRNCTTRFNVSSSQVRSWKESLLAAEAGGDIAYAEIRKTVIDPSHAFTGWTNSGVQHVSPVTTFGSNNLITSTVVDLFYYDPITGNPWYRSRSKGTAPVNGVHRTGMDDRMGAGTRGDSLLRKIDFNTDHFVAAYGPNGDGIAKALVAVPNPQITRRIEQISAPVTPFEAAIKCTGSFYGLGSAAQVDSYNSKNGPYYFCANNPADPNFKDSRSGSVEIGTPVAEVNGMLYGNLTTNGGTIVPNQYITGTIDNNVPFTVPPFKMPTDMPPPQPSPTSVAETVFLTPPAAGSPAMPTYYLLSSLSGKLIINAVGSAETYVAIHVTNDMTAHINVKPNVHVKIFFDGNMDVKGRDIDNETGLAANLQYYAISPGDPNATQFIHIAPPGNFAATFYAPSADVVLNGNPDLTGAIVCKTFYGNGNTSWHYDRALDNEGDAVDYRIASYVEDLR
jgi:Tfp pilus assembly protein PilX